jgi:adenylate cyclase
MGPASIDIEPDDMADHFNIACAFAQMGELDQALDLLQTCVRRAPLKHLAHMRRDPDFMPLHSDPRYQALIAREEARLVAATTGQASEAV